MPRSDPARSSGPPATSPAPILPFPLWDASPTSIEANIPLPPLSSYSEKDELEAPRGEELRKLLLEDEQHTLEVTGELQRLKGELQRKTIATTEMVKYLEGEIRRKDVMTKRLQRQKQDLQRHHEADLAMMAKQFENTCRFMEKIFMEKEKGILGKNDALTQQIADLGEFQRQRAQLAEELESTKSIIYANERRHKLQLDELEKQFLAARDGLQREAAERIAASRANYQVEVGRELEEESTAVRMENERLRERLRTHEATSDRLQKQHSTLTQKIHSLKQDLELRQQQNEEYLRKSLRSTKLIEQLTTETRQLEETLLHRLKAQEDDHHRQQLDHQQRLIPLEQQLSQLRSQSTIIDAEHKRIRRRARTILAQRREIATFFLTALQETRESKERKKMLQKKERELLQQAQLRELTLPVALRTKLPFIHPNHDERSSYQSMTIGGSGSGSGAIFDKPMELSDLTLEDREKVLRLLYAKISHIPSGLTVQLPSHSFDIQLQSNVPTANATTSLPLLQSGITTATASNTANTSGPSPPPQLMPGSVPSTAPVQPLPTMEYDMTFLTNMDADEDGDDDDDDDDSDGSSSIPSHPYGHTPSNSHSRPMTAADEAD